MGMTEETPSNRNRILYAVIGVIALIGLAWFLLWLFYLRFYAFTDDAYVNGNRVNLKSVIAGTPVAFYADETDLVLEGQLLVSLDPTAHQVAFDKQLAELASTVLKVRKIYDDVPTGQARVESQKVKVDKARYDYENRHQLVTSSAISQEDYTHSQDDLKLAESTLQEMEGDLKGLVSLRGPTPFEEHPMILAQKEAVRDAFYYLAHCSIYSPCKGYVGLRAVEIGQWVTPATSLMAIIPLEGMWVDANYKETQLTKMRMGQPAEVTFDVFGSGVKFKGKVIGIGFGSGSVFSLIPPQNATGNWIKIVQRVPVRIGIDVDDVQKYPLRLGISSSVYVDLNNQDLPWQASQPENKVVAATNVFTLKFEKLEERMNKIVQKYGS
jgi:membrane fusion protein, multidrug efflux system